MSDRENEPMADEAVDPPDHRTGEERPVSLDSAGEEVDPPDHGTSADN